MTITTKQVKDLQPCNDGWKWYLENQEEDLEKLLIKINSVRPDWARWLFTNLMDRKQCLEVAIFAAREVLSIFEDKYPNDDRPRKAIESAEKWIKYPLDENRYAADASSDAAAAAAAAAAADASSDAAAAAAAADAAAAAADASSDAAAADIAYAAADVAYAAAADVYAAAAYAYAAADAEKELQMKIIKHAVKILDGGIK
jgi:hypothetical protein